VRDAALPQAALLTGSTNWTNDSWTREENVIVTVASSEVAAAYRQNFEELWQRPDVAVSGRISTGWFTLSDSTRVRPYFCPGRALKLVHAMSRSLASAQTRIRICSPVITSGPILGTLAEICDRGNIDISGVYDATQMDEVQRQWGAQATASWKINAFHSVVSAARSRVLWLGVAVAVVFAVTVTQVLPRLAPSTGTVLIVAAGSSAGTLPSTPVRLHGSAGWATLGSVAGDYPAAPGQRELLAVSVVAGSYDGVALGSGSSSAAIAVHAGQVEPVPLGSDGGHLP